MSESTTERYHVRRREFLNEHPDLPAFIIGIVEDTSQIPDDEPKEWNTGWITLDLGDCYRRVSFSFDMYDAIERANSLRKISIIAEVVNAVRDAIALEVESRNARPSGSEKPSTESEQASVQTKNVTVTENVPAPFPRSLLITMVLLLSLVKFLHC